MMTSSGLYLKLVSFSVVVLWSVVVSSLKLQPEFDLLELESYMKSDRLLNLQLRCMLDESFPCDHIGRWLKPRFAESLRGVCVFCTEKQRKSLRNLVQIIRDRRPNEYQALEKFLRTSTSGESSEQTESQDHLNLNDQTEIPTPTPITNTLTSSSSSSKTISTSNDFRSQNNLIKEIIQYHENFRGYKNSIKIPILRA